MRSRADPGIVLVLCLVLGGCAPPATAPTPDPPASPDAVSSPATSVTPSPTASPEPTRAGLELPQPGRPFRAAELLREMDASTRPGGVPEAVRTMEIAEAIAASIWTFDGSAWDTFAIGGFCGSAVCTLELAGTRIGQAGEDLWVLEVDPDTRYVTVVASELRALPWELVDELDGLARAEDTAGDLRPMILGTARWLPPPVGDRFVLSYRSGGEEGSCRSEVTIDATRAVVVGTVASGC